MTHRSSGRRSAVVAAVLASAVLASASCGSARAARLAASRAAAPGAIERRALMVDGVERFYWVRAPATPPTSPTTRRPVVLVLHGGGTSAFDMMRIVGLQDAADEAGALLAYPNAAPGTGGRWALPCPTCDRVGPAPGTGDDVHFAHAVARDVVARDAGDSSAVSAVGYSMGGQLVYRIACRAPGLLARAAVVAALMPAGLPPACVRAASAPAMAVVLGTADPSTPWEGRTRPDGTVLLGAQPIAEFWSGHVGCRGGAARALVARPDGGSPVVERSTWAACAGSREVRLYRVAGAGHEWPARSFDVDRELMRFFVGADRER